MTHPVRDDPDQLAAYARKKLLDDITNEYLDICEAMEKYADRKAEVAEELVSLLGVGGRHEVAEGVGVQVTKPQMRFDPRLAEQVLTAPQLNAISRLVPDAKLANELLGDALVAQLKTTTGKPIVRRI